MIDVDSNGGVEVEIAASLRSSQWHFAENSRTVEIASLCSGWQGISVGNKVGCPTI